MISFFNTLFKPFCNNGFAALIAGITRSDHLGLFRHLRTELKVVVQQKPKKLPYVPSEEEINNYYDLVWNAQNVAHMVCAEHGVKVEG